MTKIKGVYMKRTLGLFCFAFCSLSLISCASSRVEPQPLPTDVDSQMIVNRGTWLHDGFQLADGQKLSKGQLNQLLLNVPQNEAVICNSRIMSGVSWAMLGLLVASYATNATYQIGGGDFPHTDTVLTTTYWTGFAALWGSLLTSDMARTLQQKAVDNYNLYIQGIPVK